MNPSSVSDNNASNEDGPVSGPPDAAEVYSDLIELVRALYDGCSARPIQIPDSDAICEQIARVIDLVERQPFRMIALFWRTTPDSPLISHTANVLILSLLICKHLGYPQETRIAVGLGALLYNAGMVAVYLDATSESASADYKALASKSYEFFKEFLKNLSPESEKTVRNIILQSRDVISGEAFSRRHQGIAIGQEAQIVGLCDSVEILTHPGSHQKKMLPHEALEKISDFSNTTFRSKLINLLLENLTSFPPGILVRLNTGEIARVIELSRNRPASPVVQVLLSKTGEKVQGHKVVDLTQFPQVSIEQAVDLESLRINDASFRLKLFAQQWWFGPYE